MEDQLVAQIHTSLQSFLYDNAIRYAELLAATFPSDRSNILLGSCYFHTKQSYRAHQTLRTIKTPDARYLYALSCLDLNKPQDAERALTENEGGGGGASSTMTPPRNAAWQFALGRALRAQGRMEPAIRAFTLALQLDPLLWSAAVALGELGGDAALGGVIERLRGGTGNAADLVVRNALTPKAAGGAGGGGGGGNNGGGAAQETARMLFAATPVDSINAAPPSSLVTPTMMGGGGGDGMASTPTPTTRLFQATPSTFAATGRMGGDDVTPTPGLAAHPPLPPLPAGPLPARGAHAQRRGDDAFATPLDQQHEPSSSLSFVSQSSSSGVLDPFATPAEQASHLAIPPPPIKQQQQQQQQQGGGIVGGVVPARAPVPHPPPPSSLHPPSPPGRKYQDNDGKIRKVAGRMFGENERGGGGGGGFAPLPPPPPQLPLPTTTTTTTTHPTSSSSHHDPTELHLLLSLLLTADAHLASLRCAEAISSYRRLPPPLFATAHVQCQLGRAYLEQSKYEEASKCFCWMRLISPHRLDGVEYYSTALWFQKREADLAHLAHECLAIDKWHASPYLVLGNLLASQNEHDAALKLFQRALAIDPHAPYAHTLAGHEYLALEEVDKAANCYRLALRADPRHHAAWYGLGQIFFRQEKFDAAEIHFGKALALHPTSSVLHCYRGMALARQRRVDEALRDLDRAVAIDGKNPLARFEKASLLASLDESHWMAALETLYALQSVVPREASVCLALGRLAKKMGRREEAVRILTAALDLKPSSGDATAIKVVLEHVHLPDDTDEDGWE